MFKQKSFLEFTCAKEVTAEMFLLEWSEGSSSLLVHSSFTCLSPTLPSSGSSLGSGASQGTLMNQILDQVTESLKSLFSSKIVTLAFSTNGSLGYISIIMS